MQISLYGKVAMIKDWCLDCKCMAFVIDDKLQCCGKKIVIMNKPKKIKRECESLSKKLSQEIKNKILELQHFKCYLCGINLKKEFYYKKNGKNLRKIWTEFDHFIPRSFSDINDFNNIYAMCCLCNRYKGSKMFETRNEASKYICEIREKKGLMNIYTVDGFLI